MSAAFSGAHALPAKKLPSRHFPNLAAGVTLRRMNRPSLFDAADSEVELRGTLERITYHNADTGWTICRLRPEDKDDVDLISVVGVMPGPQAGASLLVRGHWETHREYGRQLKLHSFESVMPASTEGIRMYLASGLIKGIGPTIAKRIVDRFAERTLEILDTEPERLLAVTGISPKKLDVIKACWQENQGIRELMVFLQPHDIGVAYAVRIYRQYGQQSLAVVRENPYRLAMDIHGIGFLTADALALKLGFEKDSPLRAQAATLYTLLKLVEDGHVYFPREGLIQHTASRLDIDPVMADEAIDHLEREERVVLEDLGMGDAAHQGVYLSRYHLYESRIAFYLNRILASPKSVRFPDAAKVVDEVVAGMGISLAEQQIAAVRVAANSKVMVLTGGPGTGKTTILKAIIEVFAKREAKILLAAPTGRAAKRMAEACKREGRTIHRLLEFSPAEDGFARNEDNPLSCGLLVVDEASMMDTMLAFHLLKAAPLGATIIFVGDVNQLPSVGPGNVLRDFISSGAMPVVELNEVFRQAATSAIVCNAHLINKGEMPPLESSPDKLSDFYFIRRDNPQDVVQTILHMVLNNIPNRFGLNPVDDVQVLTPMHKGDAGSARLNEALQQALNPGEDGVRRGDRIYRLGDKVMQIRNNYDKDVFNGDIGRIVIVDEKEKFLTVRYDERNVSYEFNELDDIVMAYAISIHKSQGSEYPAVVIPLLSQHYMMLQRNLVYTGVTRGKRLVVLVGESRALHMAISNNKMTKRFTWLAQRLQTS